MGEQMMRRASRAAALAFALAVLSGCGTIANFGGKGWQNTQIYGGVLRDVKSAEEWIAHNPIAPETDIQKDVGTVVGVGLIGLDIPLSALADTLTLPITIPAVLWATPTTAPTAASTSRKEKNAAPAAKPVSPGANIAQK
jgi:uncharacterized protein YceK